MITSLDGTRIGWVPEGKGPPTVLVHGTCGDKGNWIGCTPHLSGRLSLYAVDRRGRGRSGDAPEYAIQREDLAAVIEVIGEPVTLVGHSYGEIISLGALSLTWNQIERDAHTIPREIRSLIPMPYHRFDHIAVPVLLLIGTQSETYLRASVEHLASILPAARTAELPDQGHLAQAFAPELFCAQVLRFIDNVTA